LLASIGACRLGLQDGTQLKDYQECHHVPSLYQRRSRSIRLQGAFGAVARSGDQFPLENLFWNVLANTASRDGMSVPQLCPKLYDELVQERGEVDNFALFLRVCCGRYLALQLSGGLPQDAGIPIGSLNAQRELATEHSPAPVVACVPIGLVPRDERQSRVA
jgi:predicted DNA-binding ribbon-helix-helix protein